MQPPIYSEIRCETASAMLEFLRPTEDETVSQQHIFRGQADSQWKLEPSAVRTSGQLTARSLFGTHEATSKEQAHFEALVLRRFLKACDLSGLIVPGYNRALLTRLDEIIELKMDSGWPAPIFDEPLAVAQHYGVPTRLLDWTRRSFVAAYFAASAALQLREAPDRIAVWSLNISMRKYWNRVSLVSLPGGTALNLAAQSGLFTIHRGISHFDAAIAGLEAEQELYECLKGTDLPAVTKVTLPFSECPKLLRMCASYGVSAPVLFPGMDGVRKYVVDWAYSEFNGPTYDS